MAGNGFTSTGTGSSAFTIEALEGRVLLSGVTVITHGAQVLSDEHEWIDRWAYQIATQLSARGQQWTRYNLKIDSDRSVLTPFLGDPTLAASNSGEVILTVDWSAVSGLVTSSTTQQIAGVVFQYLMSSYPQRGIYQPLAQLPVHLVGHSRGASVVTELGRLLGESGVWVDQITTLDPHPILGDAAVTLTSNVVFADNYWRKDGLNLLELDDVDGQEVAGSLGFQLREDVLDLVGDPLEHSDVHSWYYGTIDTSSGAWEAPQWAIPDWWYSYHGLDRTTTGFWYSRIRGGTRPTSGISYTFGGDGARDSVSMNGLQVPNIGNMRLLDSRWQIQVGESLAVFYEYQDRDSDMIAQWFMDRDQNPYNGNEIFVSQRSIAGPLSGVWHSQASLPTTSIGQGTYFVLGKAADANGYARFAYADRPITLVPAPPIDSTAPAAKLAKPPAVKAGKSPYRIMVAYADPLLVSAASLGNRSVLVTGPSRYKQWAKLVSCTPIYNAPRIVATYQVVAPGATWGGEDNGLYTVWLMAGGVRDVAGNAAPKQKLGLFKAAMRSKTAKAFASTRAMQADLHPATSMLAARHELGSGLFNAETPIWDPCQ